MVAGKRKFDIYLSSTAPHRLRFRILNADTSFSVRLSVHYADTAKVDVYKNGVYVAPTNAISDQNGNVRLTDYASNMAKYMPTSASVSGSNLFVKEENKIYWTATGGADYYDICVSAVLFLQFGLPPATDASFFESNTLVSNFASLMGVEVSRIRSFKVIRPANSPKQQRRRRRQTSSQSYVSFEIYDDPIEFLNQTQLMTASLSNLNQLSASITNQLMTGEFQLKALQTLNLNITSCMVQPPKSNTSATEIKKIGTIVVVRQAAGCRAQSPCDSQPLLKVLDEDVMHIYSID